MIDWTGEEFPQMCLTHKLSGSCKCTYATIEVAFFKIKKKIFKLELNKLVLIIKYRHHNMSDDFYYNFQKYQY